MQPMSPATPDEAEPTEEAPAAEAQESGGYTSCLHRKPDGTYEVYQMQEPPEAEGGAGPMPMGEGEMPAAEPERQTADDLEGALKLLVRLDKQNPKDQSYAGQMSAGFQGEHREPY